jgi:hypothetical protein
MESKYRQHTAKRTVKGSEFKGGVIDFDFSVGSNTVFIPSKSYFRIGVKLTVQPRTIPANGSTPAVVPPPRPPKKTDQMTFANFCPGNLFDNCFFYAGGAPVSSCINYGPQAHALSYRLKRSGAWLNTIGKDAYGICADYQRRLHMSSDDSDVATEATLGGLVPSLDEKDQHIKYFLYQPPIGIMECEKALGSGQYRFQFNPSMDFEKSAVEGTTGAEVTPKFEVHDMQLYVCEEKMDVNATGKTELNLMEHQVQCKPWSQSLDFTVESSTQAITVFLQSRKAGTVIEIPPSKFVCTTRADKVENTLNQIQLTYANATKPPTNIQSELGLVQRWYDTQLESGQAFSSGGSESLQDWKSNGPMYHFSFLRDKDDRSTQVQLTTNLTGTPHADDYLYIVSHYRRSVAIFTESGYITNVSAINQ